MSWAEVKMAVKTIQRGYVTVNSSDVTVTINNVDPSRCLVLLDGNAGLYQTSWNATGSSTVCMYVNGSYPGYISKTRYDSDYPSFPYGFGYAYGSPRKPYVKSLEATSLTIGQSGTYSNSNNGDTVSYQIIEFFN